MVKKRKKQKNKDKQTYIKRLIHNKKGNCKKKQKLKKEIQKAKTENHRKPNQKQKYIK